MLKHSVNHIYTLVVPNSNTFYSNQNYNSVKLWGILSQHPSHKILELLEI